MVDLPVLVFGWSFLGGWSLTSFVGGWMDGWMDGCSCMYPFMGV